MAEYAQAVCHGRPCFHISLVQDISPNCDHDHFKDSNPNIEWQATLDQAEKIGLGTRQYELKRVK